MTDHISQLIKEYEESRDDRLLDEIYSLTCNYVVREFTGLQCHQIIDIALFFVNKVIKSQILGTVESAIKYIIDKHVKETEERVKTPTKWDDRYVEYHVDSELIALSRLEENLKDLSVRQKAAVLYLLNNEFSEKYVTKNLSPLDSYVVFSTYRKIMKSGKMGDAGLVPESIKIPKLQVSKVLLLSRIYQESPALVIMLYMMKDISMFYEFCAIFGNETIKIPDTYKLQEMFSETSELCEKLEASEKLTISEIKNLIRFSADVEDVRSLPDTLEVNPLLEKYLTLIITEVKSNFDKLYDRIIDNVNVNDPKAVKLALELFKSEMTVGFNLVRETISSFDTSNKADQIISRMKS